MRFVGARLDTISPPELSPRTAASSAPFQVSEITDDVAKQNRTRPPEGYVFVRTWTYLEAKLSADIDFSFRFKAYYSRQSGVSLSFIGNSAV